MMTTSVEEALLIELNYAKDRILQLEKTAKWWSESTAIWREKWGRIRNERDDLRKKIDIIFAQKNALIKEYEILRCKNVELNSCLEKLNGKKVARVEPLLENKNKTELSQERASQRETFPSSKPSSKDDSGRAFTLESFKLSVNTTHSYEDILDMNDNLGFLENIFQEFLSDKQTNSIDTGTASRALNHVKTIQRNIFFLKNYFCFDQTDSVFNISSIATSASQTESLTNSSSIQVSSLSTSDAESTFESKRKIADLRIEIEQLLDNNYKEWERRERAENKVAEFERVLKTKDQIIKELEEQVQKRTNEVQDARKYAMNIANEEIENNNEELKLSKILLSKVKKSLSDKTDELLHQRKRTEQLELETKKLKDRIEEIKSQSYNYQEKADLQESHIRKLQRSLEEERHQKEGVEMQLKHVTNRLKKNTNSVQRKGTE